jgi:DNA invertase Pin-like site-specific DNA recombinase
VTRAAAYCRVSTDRQDQQGSFESQKLYFKSYIESRPGWTLAGIYADEGVTGTTTADRTGFLTMLDDAYRGKFDILLTKEVSRFSRNILDAVARTRELKKLGIAVLFLSDGISTLDPDAELRLGIMASVAQEESRKTSERVKWGQQRKMERGVVFGRSLLGYDVRGGRITVEPIGAETVRTIFSMCFRERLGIRAIADELTKRGIATQTGRDIWSGATVLKILRNEKYCGDLNQRKTVTTDFLTHQKKRNTGEAEFICLRDHHAPIVSREEWEAAQAELSRRSSRPELCITGQTPPTSGTRYALSGRIVCALCRKVFRCRTRTGADGARYRVWTCPECHCGVKRGQLREDALERCIRRFIAAQESGVLLRGFESVLSRLAGGRADTPAKTGSDLSKLVGKSAKLADAYFEGEIGREAYLALKEKYDSELRALKQRAVDLPAAPDPDAETDLPALLAELTEGRGVEGAFYLGLAEIIEALPNGAYDITLKGMTEPLHTQTYNKLGLTFSPGCVTM